MFIMRSGSRMEVRRVQKEGLNEMYDRLVRKTNRLFSRYHGEEGLPVGQAAGKTLYEIENAFQDDDTRKVIVYAELCKINREHRQVLDDLTKQLAEAVGDRSDAMQMLADQLSAERYGSILAGLMESPGDEMHQVI